jgi:deazaflavin-dependent oxidoreductase (nitroreductase family)
MGVLDLADRSWPVLSLLMKGHAAMYRATGGRIGHRVPGFPPMLILEHVGAKSGEKRTSVLSYIHDGNDVAIIASKGGYPKNPAWFHNLKANPATHVRLGAERRPVRARVANQKEHARLWPVAVKAYPGYKTYQERTERQIPIVILERRAEADPR